MSVALETNSCIAGGNGADCANVKAGVLATTNIVIPAKAGPIGRSPKETALGSLLCADEWCFGCATYASRDREMSKSAVFLAGLFVIQYFGFYLQ